MLNAISRITVCSTCGGLLSAKGDCLACLLRRGLNESDLKSEPPASLVFGDFEVEQHPDGSYWELGRGAMGVTYLAKDTILQRQVALKVIEVPPAVRRSQAVRERFLREARAAAALRHPNVAAVFQFGASPESAHCYYAMELVEGETLEDRIRKEGPLPAKQTLEIALQVTRALVAAAAHGLIHRDLKPGNIMLTPSGTDPTEIEVKVIDFGLAKAIADTGEPMSLTHGEFIGTPIFASPEQFGNCPVDARSDIYSLGATLWFALTGLAPRSGSTIEEIRDRQARQDLPMEHLTGRKVPGPLIKLLRSMLAVDPAYRPASARELMAALKSCSRKIGRRVPVLYIVSAGIILILSAAIWATFLENAPDHRAPSAERAAAPAVPDKSIAVLPFQNLSTGEENAVFTEAVQDQILTDLAKLADLKVISRTSVMRYKQPATRNLREIAQQLGVAHVLEGSVQRAANRVRVNAQLIDARNDTHLWAQSYDRDLADVFAIQSEIARAIADQLQAKLSAPERVDLGRPPTNDVRAFEMYTYAKNLIESSFTNPTRHNVLQAVDLLNEAVSRDPQFFLAYCALAYAHDTTFFLGIDRRPARVAMAEAAIAAAFRLRPDAGEAHLARAENLYRCYSDYDGALAELAIAGRTLPNDSGIPELRGYILRRRGVHEEGVRSLERAAELDPRNLSILNQISNSYRHMRRYAEAAGARDRALTVSQEPEIRVERHYVDYVWKADTRAWNETIASVLSNNPGIASSIVDHWIECSFARRDAAAAARALEALGDGIFGPAVIYFDRSFGEGLLARLTNDQSKAQAAFTAARARQEKRIQEQPEYGPVWCVLGLIDAGLGRKEEALREGRRAIELLPVEKDSLNGALMIEFFAVICAWVGEKDLALEQLARVNRLPASFEVTYGSLKLHPYWDPLRGDRRFEKIVADLAPKEQP